MDQSSKYSINTLCVQGGYTPGNGEPRQIPIVQSTTFKYDSSDDMGKLFDLQASGYFYSRLQNPTCDTVAAKITELELSDRGSWTLTIESPTIPPTKIELGRDANGAAVEERLRQVVEAYPRIVEIMGGPPASLDARYRRAIAAGKVNREQVAEYLASVQAVSAQSSARPSLGERHQAKTQWTILRQHRLRMMPRMRHRASRMRLKAVQLPAKCSLRHMTSYNILLSNPSFPIHCSHEVSGSRPRVLCRPRHRHG